MNRIEKQVMYVIRSVMDVEAEKKHAIERGFDVDKWLESWGTADFAVIKKHSIKHGIAMLDFAKEWITLDGQEQLEIWKAVRT